MADPNPPPASDFPLADHDAQIPPIDNIHDSIPPDPPQPAPAQYSSLPAPPTAAVIDPAIGTLSDQNQNLPPTEPYTNSTNNNSTAANNANMPAGVRTGAKVNGPTEVPLKMPTQPAAHGAPVRQYINSKVTPSVLEGIKKIAIEQPEDPLRVLGEFLLQKSRELEGQ